MTRSEAECIATAGVVLVATVVGLVFVADPIMVIILIVMMMSASGVALSR